MEKIELLRTTYLPDVLEPGILYVSEKYHTAGHLCTCGCNSKVITPLGPTEWAFSENDEIPSLYPSVGNWQLRCRSHYWIRDGTIIWSDQWSEEQIAHGKKAEDDRRRNYFAQHVIGKKKSLVRRLLELLLKKLFN